MTWALHVDSAPDTWKRTQLRSFLIRKRLTGRPDLPMLSVNLPRGVVVRRDGDGRPTPSQDLSAYQVVHSGDLVMNQLGKPHGALGVSAHQGIISPAYFVASITDQADARFIHHLLRTRLYISEYERRGKFMPPSQFDISWEQFRTIPVALPSPTEQRVIANFLDAETTRIDALVTRKKKLDQLLEVRWHAFVHAVALRSGWPVVPLRRLWTVIDCKHRTPTYVDDGFPVVSPGDVTAGRLDLRRCHRFVNHADFVDLTEGGRRPRRGDIVYSRNASIGIAAYVDSDEPFTMGQDVCLIRSDKEDPLWLTYMLNSVGVDQLAEMKIGSTFDRVNIAQLLDLEIPAPPGPAQEAEARRLDEARLRIDRLHFRFQRQIALLQERRQAVVTAAVTGQLDIPGLAA